METTYSDEKQSAEYNPKTRWLLPNRLDFMTFIGKDLLAVAHDIYITFFNLKTNSEIMYVANNENNGDGVDVIAGHRSNTFVFAEKTEHPRIFVLIYPTFQELAQLKDTEVNRYKGLCMMECDLVAGFTGFPNYLVTVWNWRTQQRLLALPTGVVKRKQIYMPSQTHMLLCQCWGEGLIVWEVAQCYKRCLMMKRAKEEVTGWEISDPALVGVCWTNDGHLYAIDSSANLYSVQSDGIGMVTNLEWSEDLQGADKPSICSFFNGILIYGPDQKLRLLKKSDSTWKVAWSFVPFDSVVRLIANATCDLAAMWTARGFLYKLVGDAEEKIDVVLYTYRQRNIAKIQLIAPNFKHLATMNKSGELCIYEALSGKLVFRKQVEGNDINFQCSPVDPVLVIFGEVGQNYGMGLFTYEPGLGLQKVGSMCLTHQIVSQVVFSPTGREFVAVAKSAGHIFIFELSEKYKLTLVRYAELGRGLADSFLMKVGEAMRSFNLVLFSDKYSIGERIVCISAESGKDNKFAGKMQGPYSEVVPLAVRDCALAVPHLSTHLHVLRLSGEKGITVSVKMGPVFESGHDLRQFRAFCNSNALLTFGYDGAVILRKPDAPEEYDLKLIVSHRYESGVEQAVIDTNNQYIVHLGGNGTAAVTVLNNKHEGLLTELSTDVRTDAPDPNLFDDSAANIITIFNESEKNYLDVVEDRRVREETQAFARQRAEVCRGLEAVQERALALLERNLAAPPLHRLPLSSFQLHVERTNERLKQADKEREEIRLKTEARIRAQDKVTAWIKSQCWDTMATPRIKLFSIFSHYYVENFAVLPNQRDVWPELQLIEAFRTLEMENDADVFRPWEEHTPTPAVEINEIQRPVSVVSMRKSSGRQAATGGASAGSAGSEGGAGSAGGAQEEAGAGAGGGCDAALAGTRTRSLLDTPPCGLLQPLAHSFLHVIMLQHLARLNTQNLRLWFNKQFDELMNLKKREVGLVQDRNARLRFIIEELNTLSNLRGSFHHLHIEIKDPEWRQEEQPHKLIKVEPEECSIPPYVSPSQMSVAAPPAGGPDEFRERALMHMMDGVLEKLWHEEIKKPVPVPQCMLEKDPEHFNEDDLRLVFDYEAKVAFRNEEREKYRKMLHAEYAKLSQFLNEGIVKFNLKVKDTWLLKLKVDSIIGQENLILMRLRRTNLDRIEMAEQMEEIRNNISKYEAEVEQLQKEIQLIQEQSEECQASYDALAQKDRHMDKTFKNHFADLSPIIVDQCYKFFKKRPKWQQRASMTPGVLLQLAGAAAGGPRPPLLHPDCLDYLRALEQLDMISNMPPVMDEALWATMCKLRRTKIENEIRMRAMVQEMAYVESGSSVWHKAVGARRTLLARQLDDAQEHRQRTELLARNKTIQLVLPAGQVEIVTTGHVEDFEDAALIPREDIERINELILKVGGMKLNMMRKQMEYRKGILSKEWEHAQMKMKLRHMEQELYSYQRLKIPKELQLHLKNKELGYTEEQEFMRMEKEMEASKVSVNKMLGDQVRRVEELELKCATLTAEADKLEKLISNLNVKVSEKRLNEDPLQPIRVRKIFKMRMETLVARSQLIREVQANHTKIVLLQTELELLRLKTYPTLATFRTIP